MATQSIRFSQIVAGINNSNDPEFIKQNEAESLKNFDLETDALTKRKGLYLQEAGFTSSMADNVYTVDGKALTMVTDEDGKWHQINRDKYPILPTAGLATGRPFDQRGTEYRGGYFLCMKGAAKNQSSIVFKLDTEGMSRNLYYYDGDAARVSSINLWGENRKGILQSQSGDDGATPWKSDNIPISGWDTIFAVITKASRSMYTDILGKPLYVFTLGVFDGKYANWGEILYNNSGTTEKHIYVTAPNLGQIQLWSSSGVGTMTKITSKAELTTYRAVSTWNQEIAYNDTGTVKYIKYDGTDLTAGLSVEITPTATIVDMDSHLWPTGFSLVVLTDTDINFYDTNGNIAGGYPQIVLANSLSGYTSIDSIQVLPIEIAKISEMNVLLHLVGIRDGKEYSILFNPGTLEILFEEEIFDLVGHIRKDEQIKPLIVFSDLYSPKWCLIRTVDSIEPPALKYTFTIGFNNTDAETPVPTKLGYISGDTISVSDIDFSVATTATVGYLYSGFGTPLSREIASSSLAASAGINYVNFASITSILYNSTRSFFGINPEIIQEFNGRLFIADGKLLYFTDSESEYIGSENFIYVDDGNANNITGLVSFKGVLFVFTDTSIWRLSGYDNSTWALDKVEDIGMEAESTGVVFAGGIFFCNRTGIYLFDGNVSKKISNKLNGYTDNTGWANVVKNGQAQIFKNWYCLYGTILDDGDKQLLMLDINTGAYKLYEFPANYDRFIVTPDSDWYTQMYFVNTTGVYKFGYYDIMAKEEKFKYYGSAASAGYVLDYARNNYGDYYGGTAGASASTSIDCEYKSPILTFGFPQLSKTVESIDIYVKDTEATFTASITAFKNDRGTVTETPDSTSFTLDGSGDKRCLTFRPSNSTGSSFQITLSNADMYEFKIYEYIVNYRVKKKVSD